MFSLRGVMLAISLATAAQSANDCQYDGCDAHIGHNDSVRVLSRRKRFLVFPEGSSLQLVFCLTYPSVNVIGDIILWGNTAALAWELPQDPYSPFNHHADPLHRRKDDKNVHYTDDRGKVLFSVPYKRKPIVNPAFAKRSADINADLTEEAAGSLRRKLHGLQARRSFLKTAAAEFHRSGRKDLFRKLELFLQALGMDGRQCVLRTLCEVGQSPHAPQGSFVEELSRAVFTLPKGKEFSSPDHREYDVAHSATDQCHTLYPDCDVASSPLDIKLY